MIEKVFTLKLKKYDLKYDDKFLLKNKDLINIYGLKKLSEWKCFELDYVPGLLVIPNPFENGHQRYFIKKTLVDYPNLPHKTNIDLHSQRNLGYSLWNNTLE